MDRTFKIRRTRDTDGKRQINSQGNEKIRSRTQTDNYTDRQDSRTRLTGRQAGWVVGSGDCWSVGWEGGGE